MGSTLIQNDTLQLTREQGFPVELVYEQHLAKPLQAQDFAGKVWSFHDKLSIRNYQQYPVRNFLMENIGGKFLYWGLVHILSITHDYERQATSGTFRLIYIYTPEEMKKAYELIDRRSDLSYL